MSIPESQLDTWSHQGAAVGSRDTYDVVKRALRASDAKYTGRDFEVFLQGSYGNDTNIWSESDVDVVIRLGAIYYADTSALTPQELAQYQMGFIAGTYPYTDYKGHVVAALEKAFGTDVKPGSRAVKIKASGARRSADVIVATEFRRYYSSISPLAQFAGLNAGLLPPLRYESGICFFTSNGQINNYPKQHSANCTTKHQATNGWFKPMVRILKNMRSRMMEKGMIAEGSAPSYFLEGLLYNVPNEKFGTSYRQTFTEAIKWIQKADRTKFVCANEQYYLIGPSNVQWPVANCDLFLEAVVSLWNDWTGVRFI